MLTKEQMDALPEPCVVRHSYDGYGWLYSDNGNGSFWLERAMEMPDAEPVYSAATVIEQQAEIERLRAYVADFANNEFERIDFPVRDPQDKLDPLTDWLSVYTWQEDARALLLGATQ